MSLREIAAAPDEIEDLEVLGRAAAGDEAAVRRLFREHAARVHRTAARILGPTDPDVEDVVQQTFLAAMAGAGGFDGRSAVSTWLVSIASRRALDAARARWRRGRFRLVRDWVGQGRPPARPDTAHANRSEAEAALDVLTAEQRAVFMLHEVEGHTLKEVSEMTGTGISTLHARLKAARRRLDAVVGESERTGEDDEHGA